MPRLGAECRLRHANLLNRVGLRSLGTVCAGGEAGRVGGSERGTGAPTLANLLRLAAVAALLLAIVWLVSNRPWEGEPTFEAHPDAAALKRPAGSVAAPESDPEEVAAALKASDRVRPEQGALEEGPVDLDGSPPEESAGGGEGDRAERTVSRGEVPPERLRELAREALPEPSPAEVEALRLFQMSLSAEAEQAYVPVGPVEEPPREQLDLMREQADSQRPSEEDLERLRGEAMDTEPEPAELERLKESAF